MYMNKRTDNYWGISATLQSLKEKSSSKEDQLPYTISSHKIHR
jgi:hypothetical protein